MGVVLPRVADAAQHLDGVLGALERRGGSQRRGRGHRDDELVVGGSRWAASQVAARASSSRHNESAQRCLTPWKPDGSPELHAVACVGGRGVDTPRRDANGLRRPDDRHQRSGPRRPGRGRRRRRRRVLAGTVDGGEATGRVGGANGCHVELVTTDHGPVPSPRGTTNHSASPPPSTGTTPARPGAPLPVTTAAADRRGRVRRAVRPTRDGPATEAVAATVRWGTDRERPRGPTPRPPSPTRPARPLATRARPVPRARSSPGRPARPRTRATDSASASRDRRRRRDSSQRRATVASSISSASSAEGSVGPVKGRLTV